MNKFVTFFAALIILMILFIACERTEYVAEVGKIKITENDFLKALKTRYANRTDFSDIDYDRKLEILNILIDKNLKLNDAYDLELEKDSNYVTEMNEYRERMISSRYYEKYVMEQLVSPEEVDKFIDNQKYEVKAAHILISYRVATRNMSRSKGEAEQLAHQVKSMVDEGSDFNQLADEYSDDPAAKRNHGNLDWFTWGSMIGPFQEAAWEMDMGEVSEPVETTYGFHIIKLIDRRERKDYSPPKSDEEIYYIKKRLFDAYGDSIRIVWEAHRISLEEKYNFTLNKENVLNLAALITDKMESGELSLEYFDTKQKATPLANWTGGQITLQTLLDRNKNREMRVLVNYKKVKFLENDIKNMGTVELVIQAAREYGINDDKFVIDLLKDFEENKLLQLVEKTRIRKQDGITDEEALAFYENNQKKFIKPAEIELSEIYIKDENLAKDIIAQLNRGTRFSILAKKYSEDRITGQRDGYLGFRGIGARGAISRDAFRLGPGGKIGGPIKYRNGWVVYKTGKIREESIRRFKDVKNRAKSLMRRERIKEMRVEWKEDLNNKYAVNINEKLVRSL